MKITKQSRIPVSKPKILGTDIEFYNYFKEVIIRINNMFSKIEDAINYPRAVVRLSRTASLDTGSNGGASTWITIPFPNTEKFAGEIELSTDYKTITLRNEGHYLLCFKVSFKNNQGSSLSTHLHLRVLQNGSEIPASTASKYITKDDGDIFTFGGFTTLIRASVGDTIQFQYRVGDVDLDIESDTVFSDPRSATADIVQMEA